ncbi:putative membrane protein YqjE [Alkalibacillus filiformis]|uniref:Membrane protein YqjE n=1 Tax=Alkalibacillus filiformis TaxID=200990 RepID=A0ABU0DPE5_9BACI|nr:hypothetical protein [Alkalibacillus filiformis]MDQ0350311.1 putative membrane protein YqjE [Alkalibacillus filiformis]
MQKIKGDKMKSFFKVLLTGLQVTIILSLLLFITTLLMLVLGYSINYAPTLFGLPLFIIEVYETRFAIEARVMGLALFFIIGVIAHLVVQYFLRYKKASVQ